ncbi:hypothetical protein LN995_09685, partial [Pontibacter silvestris]|nr:hypothetical protein [Pontibacter silvestris]
SIYRGADSFCHNSICTTGTTTRSERVVGDWNGSLSVAGTQTPLVFHISAALGGTLTATIDSPIQGAKGIIPVQSVKQSLFGHKSHKRCL